MSPLVEEVDLRNVAKQHVLLVLQRAWDEVGHGGVVHLRGIALEHTVR